MYFCIERLQYRASFNYPGKYAYYPLGGSDNCIIWNDLKTLNGYFKRLNNWLKVGYYNLTINDIEYLLVVHNGNGYLSTIPYYDFKLKKIINRNIDIQELIKE